MKNYEKKDFRQLYENLVRSDWFKRAYNNKSIGECPFDIPELNESKDERIKKVIVAIMQEAKERGCTTYYGEPIDEILDWAEKKKEQAKSCYENTFAIALRNCLVADSELTEEQADIFTNAYAEDLYKVAVGELDFEVCKEDLEDFKKKQKAEGNGTDGDIMQYIKEGEKRGIKEVISFPEKYGLQKEQKPMERSKEYADCIPIIIKYFEGKSENEDTNFADKKVFKRWARILDEDSKINSVIMDGNPIPTKEQSVDISAGVPWSKEDESILNNIIAYKYLNADDLEWIKGLPKRFNLQPKQEWSEEDEKTRDWLIQQFDGMLPNKNGFYYLKARPWLAELPNRFALKPKSEWSYTDNNRFDYLLNLIKESGDNEATKKGLTGFVNRIRSLGPQQWKPTNEQYDALCDAIVKLDADDSDARFPWEGLPALHSLLNDLFDLRKK